MMGLSALNFTLPLRAERHGRTLQAADRYSAFTDKSNYLEYKPEEQVFFLGGGYTQRLTLIILRDCP